MTPIPRSSNYSYALKGWDSELIFPQAIWPSFQSISFGVHDIG